MSRGDGTFDALPEEDCDDLRRTALGLLRLLAEFATNAVLFFGGFWSGSISNLGEAGTSWRVACGVVAAEPALGNEAAADPDAAFGGSTAGLEVDGDPAEPDCSPIESSTGGEITRAVLGS